MARTGCVEVTVGALCHFLSVGGGEAVSLMSAQFLAGLGIKASGLCSFSVQPLQGSAFAI